MKLEKEKVEHIAKLARIEILDKEKEKYSQELTNILNFVEQLNKVDTEKVEPTYQVSEAISVFRGDDIYKFNQEKELIEAASRNDGNYVKVRAVLK